MRHYLFHDDFQIHLEGEPNACFIKSYFVEGLQVWKANIDIQPVFNHYKAVAYMCAYFSKQKMKHQKPWNKQQKRHHYQESQILRK